MAHTPPKSQLQIHFSGVLVLRGERKPFCGFVKGGKDGSRMNAPSVSPVVSTSVRSTLVSPRRTGFPAPSAEQAIFMNFPPAILGRASGSLGGNGGGGPLTSAGRPKPSSMSSNRVNLSSSSHSGFWPPRSTVLVFRVSPLRVTRQYGSCFPKLPLLGRFFCEL